MTTRTGYHRPRTLDEALALLGGGGDVKPISGGASLVAMMNAGIAEPRALVSLAGVGELAGITSAPDGTIRIGAFTRHREIVETALLPGTLAVVTEAARQIANVSVRNMGTIGGAVAHADPGLDLPPALVAAGARIEIAGRGGRRVIAAEEFFVDWYTTVLEPGELVSAVLLPAPEAGSGVYLKHARVVGDYAIASVAVSAARSGAMRVAVGGCGPTPIASAEANAMLSNEGSDAAIAAVGRRLAELADPVDDVRGSAEYRRALIPRMLAHAVAAVRGG